LKRPNPYYWCQKYEVIMDEKALKMFSNGKETKDVKNADTAGFTANGTASAGSLPEPIKITSHPIFHILPLTEEAKAQYKSYDTPPRSSGMDLRFPVDVVFKKAETKEVQFDINVCCLEGDVSVPFHFIPRSSMGKAPLYSEGHEYMLMARPKLEEKSPITVVSKFVTCSDTVEIHNSTNENLKVVLKNMSNDTYTIKAGTSLFQLVASTLEPAACRVVDTWPKITSARHKYLDSPGSVEFRVCPLNAETKRLIDKESPSFQGIVLHKGAKVPPGKTVSIETGYKVCCVDPGGEGASPPPPQDPPLPPKEKTLPYFLVPTESFWEKGLELCNWMGLIDADYRGELKIIVINPTAKELSLPDSAKLGLYAPFKDPALHEVIDEAGFAKFGDTSRGSGGFGSTGQGGVGAPATPAPFPPPPVPPPTLKKEAVQNGIGKHDMKSIVKPKEEPTKTKETPAVKVKEAPAAKAKEAPAKAKETPTKAKETPVVKAKEAPAKAKEVPVVKAKEAPAKAKEAPAKAKEAPAKAKEASVVKAKEVPAKAKEASTKAKAPAVTSKKVVPLKDDADADADAEDRVTVDELYA
jgi:dUTPase